ncbi:carbonate dehydratase [Solemya velesiana gill symbiont]|uniref:Carbonate dehydratase n=1 Tax=Solemya velesiana gill symbiont TaxID=1918948 RepID=A0A1T2KT74_9GAMM|nr:carbonate dehydratase [Solemya velesiana gill symbiont]
METVDWHALTSSQSFEEVDSGVEGLSREQARHRLEAYGPNRLPEVKPRSPIMRFLAQFHDVLIYVLLVAGAVTALLQHWLDAGVIFGVVVINALIGFVQEGKAEDALRAIRQMLSPQAMVLRDERRTTVPSEELVPGDVVVLQSGDKVPADLRLFHSKGLQIEEASLTGESVPVEKCTGPLGRATVLADRCCMAYSGTLVTHGQGSGIVIATGTETEIGRISSLVAGVEQLTTPLLRQMAQFGHWLTMAILGLASVSFTFGVLVRDYTASEMFLASVGLAVAAIPEGLPAIMTITLAIGVQRMASRNAIIRRLPAVETLGTVAVICSDKTGTLTRNEMTVRAIAVDGVDIGLTGTGYDVHGGFVVEGQDYPADSNRVLMQALQAVSLCNDSSVVCTTEGCETSGDPMEAALLVAGIKAGLDIDTEVKQNPRTDLIPFESEHKFMVTLHHSHEGESFIFVKGAPERVVEMCSELRTAHEDIPLDQEGWLQRMEVMAAKGYRVLAVAVKPAHESQTELTFDDVEDGLILLGLFGLIDPPRPEAIEAVRICRQAGIRVKMITGDHSVTASAIARQVGLVNYDGVLTGRELDKLDDRALHRQVLDVDVYARVTPEHKLRLVSQLQDNHHVVAMTGDGVNDAPALKRSDVGVAMGDNGTEVAKESSEMVLTDDNFATIVAAVEEGRTVYDNIRKAILFILPTNGGEALVILGAILYGFSEFPLTPVQILWVNMITAVTLALALAFEPSEEDVMGRHPRDPAEPVLKPLFLWRIAFVSVILMSGTFGLFVWEIDGGASIEQARTVAVNTLVMFEIFYLFNSRYITAPVLNYKGLFGNHYALMAIGILIFFQLVFTYFGPLQTLFGTANINLETWTRIVLTASTVLFLVEAEKALLRYLYFRRG